MRRALAAFPFQDTARRIIDKYFLPRGREGRDYRKQPLFSIRNNKGLNELTVAANFAEAYLAKEGHDQAVGVNYLSKVQLPTLSSLYGALLAGIDYIIMGAGIPLEIPGILRKLCAGEKTTLKLDVENAGKEDSFFSSFDPASLFGKSLPALKLPRFLPIVSSNFLATLMAKKASGPIDGLIIEGHEAGGHNAPPRTKGKLNEAGEPLYGDRDKVDIEKLKELNLPFWLAGSYGNPEGYKAALKAGAAGIQAGSAFALCRESGIFPELKSRIIKALQGDGEKAVFTDAQASPTGFPFKVMQLKDTIGDLKISALRSRICNLGYLRSLYKKEDGEIGYRCAAAEPAEGRPGARCLCNALLATVGLPGKTPEGSDEKSLVTLGSHLGSLKELIRLKSDFTVRDVLNYIRG